MTVSSTSSSTSKTGSSLDVAGIVSGLMEAENVPVVKLDAKISTSLIKITALGQIKSQLSALKDALIDLQSPANFSQKTAKFSNSSFATADISSIALAGSYQLEVTSLAQPAIWNVSGFKSEAAALNWFSNQAVMSSKFTPTVFKSEDIYVLSVQGYDPTALYNDASGEFPLSSDYVDLIGTNTTANVTYTKVQPTKDAEFKLNGVAFTRSSNKVNDVLNGVTLNLNNISSIDPTTEKSIPITLLVSNDTVSARPKLDALVKAYNDLYATYKQQTASSIDTSTRGVLNSDFAVASVMRQLVSGLILPMKDKNGENLDFPNDLSAMGLKLLDNGSLALDDSLFSAASGSLQTRLSAGIRIGYSGGTDLSSQIGDMLLSGGVIQDRIDSEKTTQSDLTKRKTALEDKLISVRARYTAQYAALDSLLFKLQGTSDSLKSALDGLTNSQNNN